MELVEYKQKQKIIKYMFFKKINKIVLSLLMMTSLTVAFLGAFQPSTVQVQASDTPAARTRTLIPSAEQICPDGVRPSSTGECPGGVTSANIGTFTGRTGVVAFITNIAEFLTFVAGAVAILFMIYGGYLYITDDGEETKAGKGKKILVNATIGLVVAILAYTIVFIVSNLVTGDLLNL